MPRLQPTATATGRAARRLFLRNKHTLSSTPRSRRAAFCGRRIPCAYVKGWRLLCRGGCPTLTRILLAHQTSEHRADLSDRRLTELDIDAEVELVALAHRLVGA